MEGKALPGAFGVIRHKPCQSMRKKKATPLSHRQGFPFPHLGWSLLFFVSIFRQLNFHSASKKS
jgi:hypothetical protein